MKEGANFFSETLINFSDETKKNKGTEKSKKKITKKIVVNRVKSSVYNEIKNWLLQCSEGNDKLNCPFGGVGEIIEYFKSCAEDMVEGYQSIRDGKIGKDEIINIVKNDLGFSDLNDEDAFKFSQDIAAEYWECFHTLFGKKMGKEFVEKFITSLKVEDQEKMLNGNFFYEKDGKLVVNPFYDVIFNKGKKSKISKLFHKLVKDFSRMKTSDKTPDLGGFSKRFSSYLLNIFKNKSGKEEFSYRLKCGLILDILFDDEKNSKILKNMVKKRVKAIMADVVVGSKAEDFKLPKDCTIAEFCNKAASSKKGTGAVAFGVHLGSTFLDNGYNNLERIAVACHKSLSQENIQLGNTFSELTQDISDIMNFKKNPEDDYDVDIDIKTSTRKRFDAKLEKTDNKIRRVKRLQEDNLKQVRKEINEDALIEKFKKFLDSKDEEEANKILEKLTSENNDVYLDFDDDKEENKLSEEEKKLLIKMMKNGSLKTILKK